MNLLGGGFRIIQSCGGLERLGVSGGEVFFAGVGGGGEPIGSLVWMEGGVGWCGVVWCGFRPCGRRLSQFCHLVILCNIGDFT